MTSLMLAMKRKRQAAAARYDQRRTHALSSVQAGMTRDSTPGVRDCPTSGSGTQKEAEDEDAGVRVVGVDPESDDGAHW